MITFDAKKFESSLPPFFEPIKKELFSRGFVVTLVGGVVRDYFLTGKIGADWDIELSHETIAFNQNDWKALGKALSTFGKTVFLPYDIIRLDQEGFQLEFSPPRREVFPDDWNGGGHKNFNAVFDFKLLFGEAVLRRDFTLNAMGIRFKMDQKTEFLDPLSGLEHLRSKTLHFCGPDFSKDPVRFLRAVRFALKFDFHFSSELKKNLDHMQVSGLAPVHLWNEMQKSSNPVVFYQMLLAQAAHHPELKLPISTEFIPKLSEFQKIITDPKKHESWMIALEWVGLSSESWQSYFSQSSDSSRRLNRWAQSSREFMKIRPEEFHGEFEAIRILPHFNLLFDWYFTTKQLLQKNPELALMKMIEVYLPEWIHLYRFEAVKDVKHIDPPLRAKYQVWNLCQRL